MIAPPPAVNLDWFEKQETENPPETWRRESSVATGKMLYGLISMVRPRHVVEVGSYLGHTTAWIVRALIEAKHGECSAYDVHAGFIKAASRTLSAVLGPSAPVRFYCEDLTKREAPLDCDFAFIDPDPKSLYVPVFRKLRMGSNSTLCAHDLYYEEQQEGVLALQRVLIEEGWEVIGFPQERGLLVARKP